MTSIICCIYCKDNHKFSPFNVLKNKYKIDPTVLPILIIDDKTKKFKVIIERDLENKTYNRLTTELIKDNILTDNSSLFWCDGIELFGMNGLIVLLCNNYNKIDDETIITLNKTLYCHKWWDDLLCALADNKLDTIINNIRRAENYYKIILEKIKDYEFPKFCRIIRVLNERQKRKNESELQITLEKKKIEKERIKKNRLQEQEELLLKQQEKELEDFNKIKLDMRPLEEIFKEKLLTNKKGNSYTFLAAINPDNSIIADLVMKSGEKSQLQTGINSVINDNKIKVWEYYIQQQQDISNGIKYNKPQWKKKEIEDNTTIIEIPKAKTLLNLTKTQQIQYAKIYEESLNKKEIKNTFKLDDWQAEAIIHIKNFHSCLITGPTSGGKTYVMMKGLDNIINSDNEMNLAYISPTFHLAYQTYANIKATFPKRNIAIITTEIICIPANANIYIGTAPELLNYFDTTNKNFHIGIFDEIHVSSKLYIDETNKIDLIRANCYANLLSKCLKQVIAASATITNEIDMIKFIMEQMNVNKTEKITIDMIKLVKYTTRIIPILEYNYVNNEKLHIINRNENQNNEFQCDISSKNLFLLFCRMRERDMLPGIVFDITDDIAWKTYVELINYIESMEQLEYQPYNELIEKINHIIDNFNSERLKKLEMMPVDDIVDSTKNKKGSNNKRESGLRSISSLHFKTYKNLLIQSKIIFERSILKFNTESWESLCIITKDKISSNIYKLLLKVCNCSKENLFLQFPNFKITQVHIDMLNLIKTIEDIEPEQTEAFLNIIIDKGSFYRFSNSCGMEQLKAIREPGTDENNWKLRKRMITLAEAQSINPKEIDGIIDVIMRGLEFGITIINPSLPFVIQNIILDNLRTKNLGIVFASESMSMGINYALRSVIIKSPKDFININPGKLIQMGGRCGRRGKDDQAHVIYWGITNSIEAHPDYIKAVCYPSDFIVDNYNNYQYKEKLAIQLGAIFETLYFEEERKKFNTNIPTKYNTNEDSIEEQKCKKRNNNIKLNRIQYLEPTIEFLTTFLNFEKNDIENITTMICKIDSDIIMDSYSINSYAKSRNINLLMHLVIELHNTYALSTHITFLKYLESVVHILQGCEYKLIKLAK